MIEHSTCPGYEPPISQAGTAIDFASDPLLAPGVAGYALQVAGEIWISDIRAIKEGSGDVGRFLASLSCRCCVVNVVSNRLAMMLVRRGFIPGDVSTEDGPVDVWKPLLRHGRKVA